jgi:hypothetical protein
MPMMVVMVLKTVHYSGVEPVVGVAVPVVPV